VRSLPCGVCTELGQRQRTRTEAEHPWNLGKGRKCSDILCWPCCTEHHEQKGQYKGFFAEMDIDERNDFLTAQVFATWRRWLAREGMEL